MNITMIPPTIELDISKNQMAGLLGTIPETLSRILKRMNDENLIKVTTRSIAILDKKGLTESGGGRKKTGLISLLSPG